MRHRLYVHLTGTTRDREPMLSADRVHPTTALPRLVQRLKGANSPAQWTGKKGAAAGSVPSERQ
jgi:hypothetical protein